MLHPILADTEPEQASGYNFLAIHIIMKALEDYFNDEEDEENRYSAEVFFAGNRETSTYPLLLEYLGHDVDDNGVIPAETWYDIIEAEYNSIADAKPKIGMSTRLIPTGSALWEKIREGRARKIPLPEELDGHGPRRNDWL